eukprot:gnl/MRDRNA2_/MRDRNA2_60219_c0_seq2.p1 gnl/MRDRNA2_/MRDRNA2_60219_c0~~gnl/MRDRNA2_/MRDRNA2_60219_c0_seq2.p1  ORF type:complete len:279 (-),score=78.50 gnl/MRDRNA2_/MRDRNA2_60219_c0_seq2:224-1060(-)
MYYGDDNEESIYKIIPPKEVKPEKPPMYKSTHKGTIPPTASTFGHAQTSHPMMTNLSGEAQQKVVTEKSHRTLGKAPGSHQPDPQGWLKKNERSSSVPPLSQVKREQPHVLQPSVLKTKNKPAIPKKDDTPIMNLVTSKNFVVANAVETILAAPKKTAQGAKDYLHKEDYGKVPKYLDHIKQDIDAEYEYIAQLQEQEQQQRNSQTRLLSDEEKQGLIMGLKAKWEAINTDYQAITHLTTLDTMGKVRRKEKYEAQLAQTEKDIEKLNRKNIYVDGCS